MVTEEYVEAYKNFKIPIDSVPKYTNPKEQGNSIRKFSILKQTTIIYANATKQV